MENLEMFTQIWIEFGRTIGAHGFLIVEVDMIGDLSIYYPEYIFCGKPFVLDVDEECPRIVYDFVHIPLKQVG